MTRVGFLVDYPNYIGGINYIHNLLSAARMADRDGDFEFIVFLGGDVDESVVERFQKLAEVIKTDYCERKSIKWLAFKVMYKIFGITYLMNDFLARHRIDVLSHSNFYGRRVGVKTIEWLPDFQFTKLPYMFTRFERYRRALLYKGIIAHADKFVVSSYDGASDYYDFVGCGSSNNLRVLQFVTQPDPSLFDLEYDQRLMDRYEIQENFFFLPNQLWKHKNHLLVIESLKMLKEKGVSVQVVCSGALDDFRDPKYKAIVFEKIEEYGLSKEIKFLGLIPYREVQYLMRYCLAILNPSLFEGWSSTVEEAKSIGKNMIVSDLPVHLEQAPSDSLFFRRNDPQSFVDCIEKVLSEKKPGPNYTLESQSRQNLTRRTRDFGERYLEIVREVI